MYHDNPDSGIPLLLNEQGQTVGRPKKTESPLIEREDWEALLAEKPWLIKGTIWTARGEVLVNAEK